MKKIYLMGLSAMFTLAATAQTTVRVKNPLKRPMVQNEGNSTAKIGSPAQVNQIAGNVTCNTLYVAGSTMNLEFTLNLTNTDFEYGDFISLTFPAGIAPNSSPNNPFASDAADPGADGPEVLNPIVGQTISWGNNDNTWGGIVADASYNFTVNVTVSAGTTGPQPTTYSISGDGYVPGGTDITGIVNIFPVGASLVDIKTSFIQPLNLTSLQNCNYGMDTLLAQIKNVGNTTESNINVMATVNGGSAMIAMVPGPLAPGDSTYVIWLPEYNFAGTNTYNLKGWVAQASDVSLVNDTATLSFSNHTSIPLTSTVYTNGIETAAEVADLSLQGTAANFTGLSTVTFHSGLQALFTTVANTNPAGTYSIVVGLPCMDIVNGETYRISFWRRSNAASGGNGETGVVTGLSLSAMTTVIKPLTFITPLTTWLKDSVDYVATTTETRYFGIVGTGSVTASTQMNVRLDDIMIEKIVGSVGIKTISSTEAISIFPNPTSGIINVTAVEVTSSIEVFNVIGEKVYSNTLVKGNNVIDLSDLSNGAYFVKMNSNNQVITKKVVLSK